MDTTRQLYETEATGWRAGLYEDVRALFREFNSGPVETVLPALPAYAPAVGAEGPRSL